MHCPAEEKPKPLCVMNFIIALLVHGVLLFCVLIYGKLAMREKEIVIPMDLTVVVEENLDGKEDEPPPIERPRPIPPQPQPEPPREEPKPRVKPVREPEAVEQVVVKTNIVKKVDKPTESEKQEKTAAQLREERIKKMRAEAKDAPTPPRPVRDGKTGRKTLSDKEIAELLAKGYRAGVTEQIAPNEESMCIGFLTRAIDDRWRVMSPTIGREGTVLISIRFDKSGRITASTISGSCGDPTSDAAAFQVVKSLGVIRGLTTKFLEKYSRETITIRYKIENSR